MCRRHNRVVVIGGGGAVGALFCRKLTEHAESVHAVDLRPPPSTDTPRLQYVLCDVKNLDSPALMALAEADVVVIALPESAALEVLPAILAAMKPDALLVDTLSVKTNVCQLFVALQPPQEVLSINPMFAPSLGFDDQVSSSYESLAVRARTGFSSSCGRPGVA